MIQLSGASLYRLTRYAQTLGTVTKARRVGGRWLITVARDWT